MREWLNEQGYGNLELDPNVFSRQTIDNALEKALQGADFLEEWSRLIAPDLDVSSQNLLKQSG